MRDGDVTGTKSHSVSVRQYSIDIDNVKVLDGVTLSVGVVQHVDEVIETTREAIEVRTFNRVHHTRPNWIAKYGGWLWAAGGVVIFASAPFVSSGQSNLDTYGAGIIAIAVGITLADKVPEYHSSDVVLEETRREERVAGEARALSAPVRRRRPASDAMFRLASEGPLALVSEEGVARAMQAKTDVQGNLMIKVTCPASWHLDERAALAVLEGLPEAQFLSKKTLESGDFPTLMQRNGLEKRTSTITLKPLDPEVGPLPPRLALPVTMYSPKRSFYYLAAADICDREINSKLRRVVLSVRDAATLKPVRATVELDVRAPAPEALLKPYLSGELLAQAVGRATPYARGKVRLEVKEEANPVTLYAPSTVNYKVTAPGYEEAAGSRGRVERGPLLFLLKKKLVE